MQYYFKFSVMVLSIKKNSLFYFSFILVNKNYTTTEGLKYYHR